MEKRGIDVSVWQGGIDWSAVKNDGIDFAIIRSGWGYKNDGEMDKNFIRNIQNAKAAGVKVGVYHYSYATSVENARQEAEFCLSLVRESGVSLDLPIYFDIEDQSIAVNHDKNIRTEMCIAFCSEIEKNGYWAGVYANLNWYNNYLNKSDLAKRYTLWLAQYNDTHDMNCDIWQYSSSGHINGISGNVDLNIMYRDLPSEIENSGACADTNTESNTNKPPEDNVEYYMVQSGDTLSGIAANFGTTYQVLAEINGIENPDLIYPGQVLIINKNVAPNDNSIVYYTVQSGDTLWEIAEKFLGSGTRYQEIQTLNDLTGVTIFPNQVLKIPPK